MTGEYTIAVHALVYLNHMGTMLSSEKMASNICTNPARVRKVLAKLKRAGLVETREGSEGRLSLSEGPSPGDTASSGRGGGNHLCGVFLAFRRGRYQMSGGFGNGRSDGRYLAASSMGSAWSAWSR